MENLSKDEIVQILNFYKNKSVELEFSFLVLQINHRKELAKQKEINDSEYKKLQDTLIEQNEQNIKNFNKKIEDLKLQIEKNKKTKTKNVK